MRVLATIWGLAFGLLVPLSAPASAAFDPAFEALVVVNLSAPERVETSVRLVPAAVTAHAGPRAIAVESALTLLESGPLAGRSPRWFQFATGPAILDSLVVEWAEVLILHDETWVEPASPPARFSLRLDRRIETGEVLVVNLSWDPDAGLASDPRWRPEIRLEELVEPPPGARLYVTEEESGFVAVHGRASGRMVRGLPTGGMPRDLVWDPLRQQLLVSVAGTDELLGIDPIGQETIRRLPLGFGADPTRVLLSADGERVAVLTPGRDQVVLVSTASLQEIARVRVGRRPRAMVEEPHSGRLFVTSPTSGQIDVVDPFASARVLSFGTLDSPGEIVRLQSGLLAVAHTRSRRIDLVDPASGSVHGTVELCGPVDGLVLVPRLERILALSNVCGAITSLRPERDIEFGSTSLDAEAGLPSLGPREAELYVPLPARREVLVLPAGLTGARHSIDTGPGPWRAVAP